MGTKFVLGIITEWDVNMPITLPLGVAMTHNGEGHHDKDGMKNDDGDH